MRPQLVRIVVLMIYVGMLEFRDLILNYDEVMMVDLKFESYVTVAHLLYSIWSILECILNVFTMNKKGFKTLLKEGRIIMCWTGSKRTLSAIH